MVVYFGILKPFLLLMPISHAKRMKLMVFAKEQIIKEENNITSPPAPLLNAIYIICYSYYLGNNCILFEVLPP
jgi:hypothetical protein